MLIARRAAGIIRVYRLKGSRRRYTVHGCHVANVAQDVGDLLNKLLWFFIIAQDRLLVVLPTIIIPIRTIHSRHDTAYSFSTTSKLQCAADCFTEFASLIQNAFFSR